MEIILLKLLSKGDEIKVVYVLEHPDSFGAELIEKSRLFMSEQRLKKIFFYRMEQDRINSCAVYLLLRYALAREYGIRLAPDFVFGDHEKPYLKELPEIHFNLSHCKTAVCCIVSHSNTAIDINDIRSVGDAVIRRVCSENEQQAIMKSPKPDICFMEYWTKKECYSKLTGAGMSMDFSKITAELPDYKSIRTKVSDDYVLSYYSRREEEIHKPSLNRIFELLDKISGLDKEIGDSGCIF